MRQAIRPWVPPRATTSRPWSRTSTVATYFACVGAGVPAENIFNPAAVGIVPDPTDPAKRRLFGSSLGPGGQLQLDNIHLSSAGHRLFADRLIDFMVGRGFWRRR